MRYRDLERLQDLPENARTIKLARLGAYLSQTDVARSLSVSPSYMSRVEAGIYPVSAAQLGRIVAAIERLAEGGR